MSRNIPRPAVFMLLPALLLLDLAMVPHIPPWILALAALTLGWRYLIDIGYLGYPARRWRNLLVIAVVPAVFIHLGLTGDSFQISVSLLLLGVIFKLLEMRSRRDFVLVVSLAYLLVTTGLIFSQTIPMAAWALVCSGLLAAAMITAQRPDPDSARANLRLSAILLLQATPLMLVLFVFVPRIAPLWAMPTPGGATSTGVSDEMSPGAISQLSRSSDLALRARFSGRTPENTQMYWRGVVLENFDGQTWRRARYRREPEANPDRESLPEAQQSPLFNYDVIMEPTNQSWIYTLQPGWVEESRLRLSDRGTWHSERAITQRMRYQASAYEPRPNPQVLPAGQRYQALQLPDDGDPRARELAAELRGSSDSDADYARRVMDWLRQREFVYTLSPPPLDNDTIDRFLFDTREGFCSHYAGAFVYLMRAAGVPARVVVGYQGGEANPYEDYMMVYQYNAHAWTEVWLAGQGWVRFDPTTAVAPSRIRLGMDQWLEQTGEEAGALGQLRDIDWINALRLRLDAIDYAWNRWVVSYDGQRQFELLEELTGSRSLRVLGAVLTGTVVMIMVVLAWLVLRGRPARVDPALGLYRRFRRRLAGAGLVPRDSEAPLELARRAARQLPDQAERIERIGELFTALYYAEEDGETRARQLSKLRRQVAGFHPSRRGPLSPRPASP